MKELEECIIIVPISNAESKVIFVSTFDYGGKIPGFLKHKISIERLKFIQCIKSYFYDDNQQKIYEAFRQATEIVKEIKRNSRKDLQLDLSDEEWVDMGHACKEIIKKT
jgi:hypothetical protein